MNRRAFVLFVCLVLASCQSCHKEPPKPATPPPPPPPTAEELHGNVMRAIAPMMNGNPESGPALKMTLQAELGKLNSQVHGEQARGKVESDIKNALKAAYDAEQWVFVLSLCDAVELMDKDYTRAVRYRERAIAEKNKPVTTVNGIFQIDGVTTVFMDVYLPETGETKDVKVREGEEFDGLLLEKILGNNEGVQLKYLKTEQSYTVSGVAKK